MLFCNRRNITGINEEEEERGLGGGGSRSVGNNLRL